MRKRLHNKYSLKQRMIYLSLSIIKSRLAGNFQRKNSFFDSEIKTKKRGENFDKKWVKSFCKIPNFRLKINLVTFQTDSPSQGRIQNPVQESEVAFLQKQLTAFKAPWQMFDQVLTWKYSLKANQESHMRQMLTKQVNSGWDAFIFLFQLSANQRCRCLQTILKLIQIATDVLSKCLLYSVTI